MQAQAQESIFRYDASGSTVAVVSTGGYSPVIGAQPQAGLFQTNGLVNFSVTADGDGLAYQWLSNGVAIAGATADTLSLANLPATSSGNFSVVICNTSGCVTSAPVALWLDSSGVGMPDWWQMQYFGNLRQPPDGDYDGDGVNNLDEYREGTNPTNAASYNPRLNITTLGGVAEVSPLQPYYTLGQTVTLTAIPDEGWYFLNWAGSITGLTNPATLVMNSHKSVEVVFGATNITWTNISGGNWNVPANWSPNQVPGPGNNALITVPGTYTVTVTDNESVNSLALGVGGSNQTLNISGGTFTMNGSGNAASTISGTGNFTVSGGTANMTGNTSMNGVTLIVAGGTASFNGSGTNALTAVNVSSGTLGGTSLIAAGGPLNWTGGFISGVVQFNGGSFAGQSLYLDGGRLINTGPLAWNGEIITGYGSVISNLAGATINLAANNSSGTYPGAGPETVYNDGQLNVAGAGTATIGDTFNNSGTVSVNSGALNLAGGGSDSGAFTVAAGATLNLPEGTHSLNAGSTISGAGNFTVSVAPTTVGGTANMTGKTSMTGVTLNVSGTANFDGSGTIAPAAINVTSGTLGGTNVVATSGPLNWTGGFISGVVQFNGGSFAGPSLYLDGGQLINTGTLAWNGEIDTGYGSVISNLAGASINLAANNSSGTSPYPGWPGPDTVYNGGQLNVAGTGIAIISDTFNNSGAVSVNSGALVLSGSNNLTGGTLNFGINSQSNYGKVSFPGTAVLGGTLSATLTNGFVPASGSSFTILTYSSETGVFSRTNLPANGLAWQLNYGTTATTLTATAVVRPVIQTALLSGNSFTFTWSTTPANSYQIQSTTNLDQTGWTGLGGTITATNSTMTISEPVGTNSQQFYRVVLLP